MNTHEYVVVVMPLTDEDGGGFAAIIPDLPGCLGDGETEAEAVADVRQAAEAWIEATQEMGRKIPQPGEAVARQKKRNEAMMNALRALVSYADQADDHIDKLERKLTHLIKLLEDDQPHLPAVAVIAQSTSRQICH